MLLQVAEEMGVVPTAGVRIKLATAGVGQVGGDARASRASSG